MAKLLLHQFSPLRPRAFPPENSRASKGLRLFGALLIVFVVGCALFVTRPVQEMSDTQAAIRAAREVQADTLAPELYRQANEWFFRAKNEYMFKNFAMARDYANKSRVFAEQAEFESIRNGGNRAEVGIPDPLANQAPPPEPYDYPSPDSTPYSESTGSPTPTGP